MNQKILEYGIKVFSPQDTCSNTRQASIYGFTIILSVAAFLYFLPAYLAPFHSKGEPREALVAQAMLKTGDWILPARYGDEIATKPPMAHWLMAIASSKNGYVSEFTSRLPSILLSLIAISIMFAVLNRHSFFWLAALSTITLITSALWYRSSIVARVDMPLAGFLSSALFLFFHLEKANLRNLKTTLAIILLLSAATLTKGPVALILPIAIFGVYILYKQHNLIRICKVLSLIFIPTICISLLWYLAAYKHAGDVFLNTVLTENFGRFFGHMNPGHQPHEHGVLYLFGTLLLGIMPYSLLLFLLPWIKIKKYFQNNIKTISYKNIFNNTPDIVIFSLITSTIFFIFYSIPSSKRAEYLLPSYPFIMTIFSYLLISQWNNIKKEVELYSKVILGLVLAVYSVCTITFISWASYEDANILGNAGKVFYVSVMELLHSHTLLAGVLIILPFLMAIYGLSILRQQSSSVKLIYAKLVFVLSLLVVGGLLVPQVASTLTAKDFAKKTYSFVAQDKTVFSTQRLYGLNYYLGGKLKYIDPEKEAFKLSGLVYSEEPECLKLSKTLVTDNPGHIIAWSDHDIRKPGKRLCLIEFN